MMISKSISEHYNHFAVELKIFSQPLHINPMYQGIGLITDREGSKTVAYARDLHFWLENHPTKTSVGNNSIMTSNVPGVPVAAGREIGEP